MYVIISSGYLWTIFNTTLVISWPCKSNYGHDSTLILCVMYVFIIDVVNDAFKMGFLYCIL